jgi:hypothetical protein
MARGRRRIGVRTAMCWVAPPIVLLGLGILLFSSAGRDDTYISLWPALSIANTGKYINYSGDPVEQSSSLAQVLILAGLEKLTGIDIVSLGYFLSVAAGLLAVGLTMKLSKSIAAQGWFLSGLLAASSAYLVYWSFGGLEATLYAVFGILVLLALSRFLGPGKAGASSLSMLTAAVIVFSTVRPEAGIVLACLLCGVGLAFLGLKRTRRDEPAAADFDRVIRRSFGAMGLVLAGQVVIATARSLYFHSYIPQPVIAKTSGSLSARRILDGVVYLLYSSGWGPAVCVLALATAVSIGVLLGNASRRGPGRLPERLPLPLLLSFFFVLVQLSFVVLAGGDWMEGGRFIVPVIPQFSIFLSLALLALIRKRRLAGLAAALLIAVELGATLDFAVRKSTGLPLWVAAKCSRRYAGKVPADRLSWFERTNQVHLRDIGVIREMRRLLPTLRRTPSTRFTIISTFMGMVPFHLAEEYGPEKIRFIDVNGLTDRTLTRCSLTSGLPGNSFGLEFSIKKFLARRNDLNAVCGVPEPDILFGAYETPADFDFYREAGYKIVFVQEDYARDMIPGRFRRAQFKVFLGVREELLR